MNRTRITWSIAALGLMLLPAAARAVPVTPPRAGQVGIGVQGQYASLLGNRDFAHDFRDGPGLTVRLRYRMRFDRGIGLSFESHSAEARRFFAQPIGFPTQVDSSGFRRLNVITAGIEAYKLWGTRTRNVSMLSAGAGVASFSAQANTGETVFPLNGDGFYVSLGAGVERFVYRTWALDLSTRYVAMLHEGEVNHDARIALGLIVYASY